MAKTKNTTKQRISLKAPMGGLYRRQSYQAHPPFTTPDCSNVRPDTTLEDRERIGARPGLVDHGTLAAGVSWTSTDNVRLLSQVRYLDSGSWVTKLVAVVDQEIWWKTGNETAQWTKVTSDGSTALVTGTDSLTAADMHQKLYIADGGPTHSIKVYDPSDNTVESTPTFVVNGGSKPVKCKIVLRYHDRLVMCEDGDNPQRWYMSRSGTPLDFDFSETDALAAIYSQNTNMGQLGEPIRAAAPHGDQCIIFLCDNSTWTLRSDPGFGGRLDNLSQRIGCVSRNAWCRTSEGWLFWLSQEGVCAMAPGCGDQPISVSRERVPDDLMFIQNDEYHVSMEYDARHRGIHLYVTPIGTNPAKTHYWLDIKQTVTGDKGASPTYWPMTLSKNPVCTGVYEGAANDNVSDVLLGTESPPVVRQFDERIPCEAASYCDYGPLSTMGKKDSGYTTGSLDQINAVMASSAANGTGDNVAWSIRTGQSAEEAFDASARDTGTWRYHNNLTRVRVRDPYYVLRVSGAANKNWAVENVSTIIQPRTKMRFTGG
jgi:hypothetical protein